MDNLPQPLRDFIADFHPKTKLLAIGEVTYPDFKDRVVTNPAILTHNGIYNQTWAWEVNPKGKIGNILPMFFAEIDAE